MGLRHAVTTPDVLTSQVLGTFTSDMAAHAHQDNSVRCPLFSPGSLGPCHLLWVRAGQWRDDPQGALDPMIRLTSGAHRRPSCLFPSPGAGRPSFQPASVETALLGSSQVT